MDGGENFALLQDLAYVSFADKDWLMVDPITDALYVFWTDFVPGGQDVLSVMFRRSVDGGVTFSDPVSISDPDFDAIAAVSSSGPNGELYVSFFNFSDHIFINRSLDGGITWLRRPAVVEGDMVPPALYRGGLAGLPAHAVDLSGGPHRGRLYVVWPDARADRSDILLRHSDDRGDTWSNPVRVSDTSIGDDVAAALPWVAVDDDGRVHVTFLGVTGRFSFEKLAAFLATSTDGGLSFAPNVRISEGNTTFFPNGDFLGDYNQMIVAGGLLHPIWSDARLGDSDIFTQLLPVNYLGGSQ
jgi:hypothetical protein